MIKVGITGSLASGKTTASKIISFRRGPLFSADKAVKEIYKNKHFKSLVSKRFKIKNNSQLKKSLTKLILKNKNNIDSYVLKDTILEKIIQKKGSLKLSDIKRKIIKVDYESRVPILFDRLLREREHISLAIDKKGAIMGLVTLEDVIETVFGLEIVDESDTVVDLQVLAKQKGNKIKK